MQLHGVARTRGWQSWNMYAVQKSHKIDEPRLAQSEYLLFCPYVFFCQQESDRMEGPVIIGYPLKFHA